MFDQMRGRVALITGATSGIGAEAALLFAEAGMHVALAGRNKQAGEALSERIRTSGGKALSSSPQILLSPMQRASLSKKQSPTLEPSITPSIMLGSKGN